MSFKILWFFYHILAGGSVRIIAGTARGRTIETPQGPDTRPTLDRVREALFGMLQFEIAGSTVLDLFAGSGAMGLEAASRGAKRVVCNDVSPVCVKVITENCERLGFGGTVRVMQADYAAALDRLRTEGDFFDIVFLDAPYQTAFAIDACQRLFGYGMIADNGIVAVEHRTGTQPAPPAGARLIKTRTYGDCAITLFEREIP